MAVQKQVDLPEKFGRYRILKLLGRGGMGAVYLARDEDLGREIALKVPQLDLDESPEALDRFYQEARAAAAFRHKNICPVFEVGEINGIHYLTMAYIDGEPLTQWGRKGSSQPHRKVVELVRKIALALAEAHKNGVIHRDLKPSNVMIDSRGEPIVMDFGLARRDRPNDSRITRSGMIMGSPAYMSPEQIRDIRASGPGCDIYGLGVVLYELLAHRLPFMGDTMSVLSQVLVDPPPPPSRFCPDLDPALEAICLKALEKDPKDRHVSMAMFAVELLRYLRGDLTPAPPTEILPPPVPPPVKPADHISIDDLGGRRSMMMAYREIPAGLLGPERKSRKSGEESAVAEKKRAKKRSAGPKTQQQATPWLYLGIVAAFAMILIVVGIVLLVAMKPSGGASKTGQEGKDGASANAGRVEENSNPIPMPPPVKDFLPLFNGKDRSGWVVERGADVWRVEDEELFFTVVDDAQKGWLVTKRIYGDYLLSLRFKLAPRGNSGVALRLTPGEEDPASVQIQDDSAPLWAGVPPNQKTGALFNVDVHQPAELRPVGEWNDMEIELIQRTLRVSVNNRETLRKILDTPELRKKIPASGRIGLEHNTSSVRFRDLKIIEHTPSRAGPPIVNQPTASAIDLITRIEPKIHGVEGNWVKRREGILSPLDKWPRLQIPYKPPSAYRIDMVVERREAQSFTALGSGFAWLPLARPC